MGPIESTITLADGRVTFDHLCLGERVETTLNNADWTVVSTDPITVEPSVACDRCGMHGWISEGVLWGTWGQRKSGTS